MLEIAPGQNSAGAGHGDEHHQRQTRAETEIEVYGLQSRSLGISLFLTSHCIGMAARRQSSRSQVSQPNLVSPCRILRRFVGRLEDFEVQ
jgi:hypothetical protein